MKEVSQGRTAMIQMQGDGYLLDTFNVTSQTIPGIFSPINPIKKSKTSFPPPPPPQHTHIHAILQPLSWSSADHLKHCFKTLSMLPADRMDSSGQTMPQVFPPLTPLFCLNHPPPSPQSYLATSFLVSR